jgi:hypothetical protein
MSVDLSTWTQITTGLYSNSDDLVATGVVHIIVLPSSYTGSWDDLQNVINASLGGTWTQTTFWNNVGTLGARQMEADFTKSS